MRFISFFFLLFCISNSFFSQKTDFVFYNVENLFDTIDDPHHNDNEYLPENKKNWNTEKLNEKLKHINQVLDYFQNPGFIGLCEVENKKVVELLVKNSSKRKDFGIVHYESKDERGIDVCLLYNQTKFKLIQSGFIRFSLPDNKKASTRDIVWGKFLVKKDTFFVLVNHWPSRIGGKEESEHKRVFVAQKALHFVDSIQKMDKNVKIVLMGDLNDSPEDKAPQLLQTHLVSQINHNSGQYGGSHCYQNEWEVLDHLLISQNLLGKGKGKMIGKGQIVSPDFLMETYKEKTIPHRTYAGTKYIHGYSDHLPVLLSIKL